MNQGQYRNRASFGKRQEYVIISELLEQGFDVYIPLVDDRQIDCVIRRRQDDYIDVQIKARSRDCSPFDAGRFAAMNIPAPRDNYYFILYSEQAGCYWVFPSVKLVQLASQNKQGENIGKYHINLTGLKNKQAYPLSKFDEFKNNLQILRQ